MWVMVTVILCLGVLGMWVMVTAILCLGVLGMWVMVTVILCLGVLGMWVMVTAILCLGVLGMWVMVTAILCLGVLGMWVMVTVILCLGVLGMWCVGYSDLVLGSLGYVSNGHKDLLLGCLGYVSNGHRDLERKRTADFKCNGWTRCVRAKVSLTGWVLHLGAIIKDRDGIHIYPLWQEGESVERWSSRCDFNGDSTTQFPRTLCSGSSRSSFACIHSHTDWLSHFGETRLTALNTLWVSSFYSEGGIFHWYVYPMHSHFINIRMQWCNQHFTGMAAVMLDLYRDRSSRVAHWYCIESAFSSFGGIKGERKGTSGLFRTLRGYDLTFSGYDGNRSTVKREAGTLPLPYSDREYISPTFGRNFTL